MVDGARRIDGFGVDAGKVVADWLAQREAAAHEVKLRPDGEGVNAVVREPEDLIARRLNRAPCAATNLPRDFLQLATAQVDARDAREHVNALAHEEEHAVFLKRMHANGVVGATQQHVHLVVEKVEPLRVQ